MAGLHHLAQPEPAQPWSYKAPKLRGADLDRARTLPWHPDELARVEGFQCVYQWCRFARATVYRLPGGGAMTAAEIFAHGWRLEAPRRERPED